MTNGTTDRTSRNEKVDGATEASRNTQQNVNGTTDRTSRNEKADGVTMASRNEKTDGATKSHATKNQMAPLKRRFLNKQNSEKKYKIQVHS